MNQTQKGRKSAPKAVKRAIINEQQGRCGYCNASLVGQDIEWDHFIPYAFLGSNPRDNWVASCRPCNRAKKDHHFITEDELTDFCIKMIKDHGSFEDGWPDGSTTEFIEYA